MSIEQKPWFEWMEGAVRTMYDLDLTSIAFVALLKTGETMTAYFNASVEDKAVMVHHINSDIVLDIIKVNADEIKRYLEEADNLEE